MKKIIFLFFIFCITHFAWSEKKNNVYQYVADLIHVENNKIKIKLTTPTIEKEEIIFFIPNSIPGTYEISTYGRFIYNVQAWTKDNKELEVEKVEVGSWKIKNATLLAKLTYEVLETDPSEVKSIAEGTDFIENEHFLINNYCLFGYFEGLEKFPYVITYLHPPGLYGATSLKTLTSKDTSDTYIISSYKELADSPIMYNALDTTSFMLGGAEIIVSVYSPSKLITAKKIGVLIREIITKASCYFNGEFPVKKYVFLIKGMASTVIQANGLEHSFSSIIELSDREITSGFSTIIREVALHEFLHIQTPLAIRSEEVEYFDFNKPAISKHLWLYEGVTEYNAWSILAKSGLLSEEEFIHQVRRVMFYSAYFNDTISLTELSKNCLDKYSDQYYNIYLKGFLAAMCLDLKLLNLSNGKFGIKEMIEELEKRYKKGTPFKDDELFDQIVTLSGYPEIKNYFGQYIEKPTPIPYKDFLELAGFNYKPIGEEKLYTFGASFNEFILVDGSTIDKIGKKLGYQQGDKIISINGIHITEDLLIENYPFISKKDKKIEVVVARRNLEGKEEQITLQTKNKKIKRQVPYSITSKRRPSKKQKMIRKEWLHDMRSKSSCNY